MAIKYKITLLLLVVTFSSFSQIAYDFENEIALPAIRSGKTVFNSSEFIQISGQPQLPTQSLTFLLPPSTDMKSVNITFASINEKLLEENYSVSPAPLDQANDKVVLPEDRSIVDGRDESVYKSNSYFPFNYIFEKNVQELRDYKMVKVVVSPYRYNPVAKKLKRLISGKIEISYIEISYNEISGHSKRASYNIPLNTYETMKSRVVNLDSMGDEYKNYPVSSTRGSGYVIITTNAIKNGSSKLASFVTSKENRGFNVSVVTESEWGSGADDIRNWLKNNYQSKEIEYVCLIGNPTTSSGDVPMKMCYPWKASNPVPTDFYYADLSGNWDNNGNSTYGEFGDVGPGGIDNNAEIHVGRIPVYGNDYQTLDKILQKTIDYENAPANEIAWRKNLMLVMKGYNNPQEGVEVGEEIKASVKGNNGWDVYRIYDAGTPELAGVSENFFFYAMSLFTAGFVEWMTHGHATEAMSTMTSGATSRWDADYQKFVFCGSCLNATPSNSNNLTYSLLKNGAIGAIGGTLTTLFSTGSSMKTSGYNKGFLYQFGVNLAVDEMHASDALDKIKASNSPVLGNYQNYLAYNLYGCPAVGITTNGNETGILKEDNLTVVNKKEIFNVTQNKNNINLSYDLSSPQNVKIEIFNTQGKSVATIVNSYKNIGSEIVNYKIKNLSSGPYFVKFKTDKSLMVKNFVILK